MTIMFNDPSYFFPKAKAVIMQVQRRAIFLHRVVCSPLDREARKLSGARCAKRDKRQTSARSANARAGQLVDSIKQRETRRGREEKEAKTFHPLGFLGSEQARGLQRTDRELYAQVWST